MRLKSRCLLRQLKPIWRSCCSFKMEKKLMKEFVHCNEQSRPSWIAQCNTIQLFEEKAKRLRKSIQQQPIPLTRSLCSDLLDLQLNPFVLHIKLSILHSHCLQILQISELPNQRTSERAKKTTLARQKRIQAGCIGALNNPSKFNVNANSLKMANEFVSKSNSLSSYVSMLAC